MDEEREGCRAEYEPACSGRMLDMLELVHVVIVEWWCTSGSEVRALGFEADGAKARDAMCCSAK